jgi:hypothetical protein
MLAVSFAAGPAVAEVPAGARAFLAPSFTTAALVSPKDLKRAPCKDQDCVRHQMDALTTARLQGEFGSFEGLVEWWGPGALVGFTADPEWRGTKPSGPVDWAKVQRVDEQVNNAGRGAVIGALFCGLVAASVTFMVAGSSDNSAEAAPVVVAGVAGVALGAFVGGVIGTSSKRWKLIYARP